VVNRSEGDVENINRRRRRDKIETNEIEVTIRVSYKTLAMIFALFGVLNRIVDSLSSSELSRYSETLTGLLPF